MKPDRWKKIEDGIFAVTLALDAVMCGDDGDDDETKDVADRLLVDAQRLQQRLWQAFEPVLTPPEGSAMSDPTLTNVSRLHRYTITSEGASKGYFRLVEDPAGAWVTYAEAANLRSAQAGPGVVQVVQALRKLPRYWMHIPNAAASSTQVVCWVDVQRVLEDEDVQADLDAFTIWRAHGKGGAPPPQAWQLGELRGLAEYWRLHGPINRAHGKSPVGIASSCADDLLAALDRAVALPEEQ